MALKNLLKQIFFSQFLLFALISESQIATTPYSIYRLGTESFQGNVYSASLGYSGIALQDSIYINTCNPASMIRDSLNFTFDFAFIGKSSWLKTENSSMYDFTSNMNYMTAAFRFFKFWSTSVGLLPYTSSEYQIKYVENNQDIGEITHYLNGTGGINRVYFTNSFRIKNFSIGFDINYLFGYMTNYSSVVLPGGNYYFNTASKKQRNFKDFIYNLGVQYNFKLYDYKIILGAIYTPKQSINTSEKILHSKTIYLDYNRIDTIYYSEKTSLKTDLPEKYGFGITVLKKQWLFTTEFLTEMWENTEWAKTQKTINSSKYHTGIEYTPTHNILSQYYKKMSYRMGFYYEKTGLYINDKHLTKMGITIGTKMPLKKTKQSINFSIDFGKFGTLANKLIKENYIQFRVGLNLHEVWFVKPKIN